MVILESPAESLTFSIYGFSQNSDHVSASTPKADANKVKKENWGWLSAWAGDTSALLDCLDDSVTRTTRDKALDTLDLLADIQPILRDVLDHPSALPFLLSLPSYPAQPLLRRLYADPTHALHPNLRNHLPHSHLLKKLVRNGRKEAWKNLELGRGALLILVESSEDDLMEVSQGNERSNLVMLSEYAQRWAEKDDDESKKCLELALDLLDSPSLRSNPIARSFSVRTLPDLTAISRTRGLDCRLETSSTYARQIVKALVSKATLMVDGKSCWPAVCDLARPFLAYLDNGDPLRTMVVPNLISAATPISFSNTLDGRRVSRLASAIFSLPATPSHSSPHQLQGSIHHQVTASELVSIIAPVLHRTLSTAPIPPLGITPISDPTPGSYASNWAGKVYSSHEFRDRGREKQRDDLGSGIAAGPSRGSTGGTAIGNGARPPSRHVDEYA